MSFTRETFVQDVIEFNRDLLGLAPRAPSMMPVEESAHLTMALQEELQEFNDAVVEGNVVGAVDAIVDLMYFAVGGLWKLGLSHEQMVQCMKAVHAANMLKRKGKVAKRHTGAADAVKPEDWVAPEETIRAILVGIK